MDYRPPIFSTAITDSTNAIIVSTAFV
jgi:hypothetical protein